MTITVFTKDRVAGTFSGTGRRFVDGATMTWSNGKFDVPIIRP